MLKEFKCVSLDWVERQADWTKVEHEIRAQQQNHGHGWKFEQKGLQMQSPV